VKLQSELAIDMAEDPRGSAQSRLSHAARFTCRDADGLWVAIERAVDNGFGVVFVTDSAGAMTGILELETLRAAIRKGAHLDLTRAGDLAVAWTGEAGKGTVTPVLDTQNRIVDIIECPEATLLPVAEPDLSHQELRNLLDAYLSTWISSTGDYIRNFEASFAARVGMAHGVATSNGTVSLHLALAALGIGEGDEVIVPDFTFAASINTVMHVGARPVLVDVDPDTWCLSPATIEKAITPRTRAVMPVHVFGRPAPMTEIAALAKARNLFVIEDCAEAHGARYDGKPVGAFSDVASFSFYANKIVTTGEGGICLTNDPDLAARMRVLRDHGMRPERRYWHEEPGFNFRMTNMQAAIGCAQLERMDELVALRRRIHAAYEAALGPVPGVKLPPQMDARCEPVIWFSCVLTPPERRSDLIAACRRANIDLRPFFHSLSAMPPYKRFAGACPISTSLSLSGVNLPTFRKVDDRVVAKIADIFSSVLGR
jgi:perosamine synthetase